MIDDHNEIINSLNIFCLDFVLQVFFSLDAAAMSLDLTTWADGNVLCISTSKLVLGTPFAGWNHLFRCFSMFFHHKWDKRGNSTKITKNMHLKGVYQHLGATLEHFLLFFCAFFSFFTVCDLKRWKNLFECQKNYFNQRRACRASIRWSKYTT